MSILPSLPLSSKRGFPGNLLQVKSEKWILLSFFPIPVTYGCTRTPTASTISVERIRAKFFFIAEPAYCIGQSMLLCPSSPKRK